MRGNTTEISTKLMSYRVAVKPSEIAVFDFLSDEHVHLPFNEAYLRILRAAYPDDRVWFRGAKGHVDRLAPRVADIADIVFQPCQPFGTPFGLSHHNPLAGGWAARQCLRLITQVAAGRPVRLIALLGFNASLLSVMGRGWSPASAPPLHMVLHSQLGEAMVWRSRNPFIRSGDLISQITRPLAPSVRIVVLELGIKEAISDASPTISPSIVTLEHPILRSEWAQDPPVARVGRVKIAFVGHARQAKGFDVFVQLAGCCSRNDIEFHAIGHSSPETEHLDTSALTRKPSKTPLPREEYLAALEEVDLVCLPLHSRAYDFTGSGTVSDAIASLKPIIVIRNRTMKPFSIIMAQSVGSPTAEMIFFELVRTLDPNEFSRQRSRWLEESETIREARRPETLAESYAASISMTERA